MNDKVRDLRRKEKFVVDDEYLNGMARICGSNATIAYMSLCRHSSKQQTCFPSLKLMAEQHGVSTRTILRGLQKLEERNVIKIDKKRTKDGKWLNNSYTLLDKTEWDYSQVTNSHVDSQVTKTTLPSDKNDTHHVTNSHTKDTHIKDTHIRNSEHGSQGVSEMIKEFETVDPKNKTYYGNKTQRKACEFLISEYGFDEVKKVIAILPESNRREYYPRIYTPVQLRDKWKQLGDAITSKRSEKKGKGLII